MTASGLAQNAGYGIRIATPGTVATATLNYWGAASGPYHPTLNPTGAGQSVSDGVLFTPWSPAFIMPGDGRLSSMSLASNNNRSQEMRYGYDVIGQLARLDSRGYSTFTLAYSYNAAGRVLSRIPSQGHALTDTYRYDAAGQLTQLAIGGTAGLIVREDYGYDAVGNLISRASNQDGSTTYTYDALNRLTGAASSAFNATFDYDAAGNRTRAGNVTYTYDAGGRLVSASDGTIYSYDTAGNLTSRTRSGQATAFSWDGRNRLTRIDYPDGTYSAYQYDDLGRRIGKRGPDGKVIYFVYVGYLLMQELDGSGTVIASYTYALDRPVSMWRDGATFYYVLDRLGNVLGLADSSGALVARYRYDPWGNVISSTGSLVNPLRFTSREYDAESGLYFFRARYYDPRAGRFISRDPLGIRGGSNLYAYGFNRPLVYRDPTGTFVAVAVAVGAAAYDPCEYYTAYVSGGIKA